MACGATTPEDEQDDRHPQLLMTLGEYFALAITMRKMTTSRSCMRCTLQKREEKHDVVNEAGVAREAEDDQDDRHPLCMMASDDYY